jgi:hypothetical protein
VAEINPEEMLKIHSRRRLRLALLKQTASVLPAAPFGRSLAVKRAGGHGRPQRRAGLENGSRVA